jgi:hypothetical protein
VKNPEILLKWSLLAGSIYFLLVAFAHFLGIKIPGLYIYFDIQSHAYQDRIIAFLSFGWCMFLYSGYQLVRSGYTRQVRYLLLAGILAIISLMLINNSSEIKLIAPVKSRWVYMLETLILFLYTLWLVILYVKSRKKRDLHP